MYIKLEQFSIFKRINKENKEFNRLKRIFRILIIKKKEPSKNSIHFKEKTL